MADYDYDSARMKDASYAEASWDRFLLQQVCGLGGFFTVLILTRLWTSFSHTRFLKRRHKGRIDTLFCLMDILFSTASMFSFIAYSDLRAYNVLLTVVEGFFAVFYLAAMMRRLWLKNFDYDVAITFSNFFDSYSIAVILYQIFSGMPTFLTPLFMRSMAALIRYEEMLELGLLNDWFGEVRQRLGLSALRFICITYFFACCGFCIEILGDIDINKDDAVDRIFVSVNPDYEMTILKQLYYVVVTLSTVGYGDISPDTTIHQIFAMIMIVSGVLIASSEVSAIMALKDSIDTGTGQYRRSRFRNSHIIVLGGAVTSGSATLQIFLEELLHPSRPSTMLPDVVLMSEEAPGNGLRRILASPLGRQHVRFIRGSPMDQSALARADAANADMSFIMGDLSCLEHLAHAEDEDTILRASLLQRQLPGLPVRVLLLRPWAKEMARTAGINPLSCLTSGVLNYYRTALSVRVPGVPVLLTTMYSKLAGDWSQLPSSGQPWVREYFTSMRHDVYGAQVGPEYDGMPFLKAAAIIYKKHDVNLLAVQSAPENGGRLCPAGLANGKLHVLAEGDVVMCLGRDVDRVLKAVGSVSKHPDSWRKRFHAVRKMAAKMGIRRETFSPTQLNVNALQSVHGESVHGAQGVHRRSRSQSQGAAEDRSAANLNTAPVATPAAVATLAHSRSLDGYSMDAHTAGKLAKEVAKEVRAEQKKQNRRSDDRQRRVSIEQVFSNPALQGSSTGILGLDNLSSGDMHDSSGWNVNFPKMKSQQRNPREIAASEARTKRYAYGLTESGTAQMPTMLAHPHPPVSSKFDYKGSLNVINLCDLAARLTATAAVQDAALVVRQQRAMGLEERDFTPNRTIKRIAQAGNHILVISDAELDEQRWEDIEVLLYRLRGNDGCNIKPIVVVTRTPPSVQRLITWRSIDVYVSEGFNVNVDKGSESNILGFDVAHCIVLLADVCSSDNELLMDRKVLLATSVLERACEGYPNMAPHELLPKVILEFHHPKSVWHVRETKGFGSLASELTDKGAKAHEDRRYKKAKDRHRNRRGSHEMPPRASMSAEGHVATLERFRAQQYNDSPMPGRGSSLDGPRPGARLSGRFNSLNPVRAAVDMSKKDTRGGKIIGGLLKFCGVLDMEGNERGSKANYNKYRERFQDHNRLSWIEHPESHTQYARGNVMFRTEVSRVMATVFYTPGLMELVDSLTRDARAGENVGHHPRIWSVPLPEPLHGKTVGDAFDWYADSEALVIGVYRNVKKPRRHRRKKRSKGLTDSSSSSDSDSDSDSDSSSSDDDSDDEGNRPDHSYVLTAPPHVVRLNPTDTLYIIATTAWAWSNLPELIELRKVFWVIFLQRQFRLKCEQRREKERLQVQKAAGYGSRSTPELDPSSIQALREQSVLLTHQSSQGANGEHRSPSRGPTPPPRPRSTSPP